MKPLRPETSGQRPSRFEPDFIKMLLLSVLLHLLLIAVYFSPWFQQSSAPPPVYEVSLVNAPVLNPQAGRPEAADSAEPAPAPLESAPAPPPPPPAPVPEPEPEPEPEEPAEPEPEPEPETEPELIPAIDELAEEEQRLQEEQRQREEAERLAEEQRQREEAEKQRLAEEQRKREEEEKRRLAEEQRKREEAEKRRLAEEQRKREEAEQRRLAEEQRQREEAMRQQRLDELAAERQRQEEERARQERLDTLRAAARSESRQVESPIADAPVGMPDGRGTEAGVSPSAFVREFIQRNWTFAGHQAVGNPEAEVYLLYNASGSLISHRFVRRSGNTAFDESLVRALTLSRQLPQPLPQTMEFRVVFNLKEMLNR